MTDTKKETTGSMPVLVRFDRDENKWAIIDEENNIISLHDELILSDVKIEVGYFTAGETKFDDCGVSRVFKGRYYVRARGTVLDDPDKYDKHYRSVWKYMRKGFAAPGDEYTDVFGHLHSGSDVHAGFRADGGWITSARQMKLTNDRLGAYFVGYSTVPSQTIITH
jgi:hypothetical protein